MSQNTAAPPNSLFGAAAIAATQVMLQLHRDWNYKCVCIMKGDKACHVLLDSTVKICPFLHWIEEFIAMRSALAILWTAQISECGLMINGNRKIEEDLNWFWPEVIIEINPIHFLSFLRLYLCNSTVIKNTIHVHILRAKIIWKYKQAVHAISLQDELRGE